MQLHEYQRSRSFFDLGHRLLGFQILILFCSKIVELLETKYHVQAYGSTGMKSYTNGIGLMTKIAAIPYMLKTYFTPKSKLVA